jgi:CRP/FNR family cyclic AMP-dependent transcriptional regulator
MHAVPARHSADVESALGSASVVSLSGGSSLGADRLEAISIVLVEDGLLLVSACNSDSGRRMIISLAGSGSALPRPSDHETLEALTQARVTLVPSSSSRHLLEIPAVAVAIVEGYRAGLEESWEGLAHFAAHRHVERVRLKLFQLARNHGKVGTDGVLLDLPLTHELLADMVGSTRETVTRALAQLAREGIVHHEGSRYRIAVPPAEIGS